MGLLVEGMELDISRETLEGRLGFKINDERGLTVQTLRYWLGASSIEVVCDLCVADISTVISKLFPRLAMVTISCMAPTQEAVTVRMEVGGEWGREQSQLLAQYAQKPPLDDDCPSYIEFGFLLDD